jgi:hypothetical protein
MLHEIELADVVVRMALVETTFLAKSLSNLGEQIDSTGVRSFLTRRLLFILVVRLLHASRIHKDRHILQYRVIAGRC